MQQKLSMRPQEQIPHSKEAELIGCDTQDIEATLVWIEYAKKQKDYVAMSDLFEKLRTQINELEDSLHLDELGQAEHHLLL